MRSLFLVILASVALSCGCVIGGPCRHLKQVRDDISDVCGQAISNADFDYEQCRNSR